MAVFENRQPAAALNKVIKDDAKNYSYTLFIRWN